MAEEEEAPVDRLRKLLALEMVRIVEDLELRRDFLVDIWGRHRSREPFLDTLHTRWRTVGWPELGDLPTEEYVHVDLFYRELERLRMYFQFTEDMPTTLETKLGRSMQRLEAASQRAIEALGGLPPRPEHELLSPWD